MRMTRSMLAIVVGLAVLPLTACTTSSQVLPVTPQVNVEHEAVRGAGRTIALKVSDARPSEIVGYRDPDDPQTVITASPEMLENILRKLESAYTELGYTIVEPGEEADIAMHVQVTELLYARASEGLVKDLRTGATVYATSVMAGQTVTGTYRHGQGKDTFVLPSRSENAEILNAHLDGALSKLVADPRLTSEN
jgi:uncharacterized lipoprotein YajG